MRDRQRSLDSPRKIREYESPFRPSRGALSSPSGNRRQADDFAVSSAKPGNVNRIFAAFEKNRRVVERNLQPSSVGIAKRWREIARVRSNKHIYLLNTLRARARKCVVSELALARVAMYTARSLVYHSILRRCGVRGVGLAIRLKNLTGHPSTIDFYPR